MAKMPNAPTPERNTLAQLCTVPNASPKAVPTIGTKLDTTNFTDLLVVTSTALPNNPCIERRPEKIVIPNPNTHFMME